MGQVWGELSRDGVSLDPDGDVDAGGAQRGQTLSADEGIGILDPDDGRRIPAAMIASVHGGVRPWWLHGSSVLTSVAPTAASPARRSASRSACAPPGGCVAPMAMICPSASTTTAPTHGFGEVVVRTAAAASMAARIAVASTGGCRDQKR